MLSQSHRFQLLLKSSFSIFLNQLRVLLPTCFDPAQLSPLSFGRKDVFPRHRAHLLHVPLTDANRPTPDSQYRVTLCTLFTYVLFYCSMFKIFHQQTLLSVTRVSEDSDKTRIMCPSVPWQVTLYLKGFPVAPTPAPRRSASWSSGVCRRAVQAWGCVEQSGHQKPKQG